MAPHGPQTWFKTPESSSVEEQNSISSSDDSTLTPSTPPSPVVLPRTPPLTAIPVPPIHSRFLTNGAPKSSPPRSSPARSRLGAIDEDSEVMSPDLPARNPLRRFGVPDMKSMIPSIPTLYSTRRPHQDPYNDLEGPKGEKFQDMRQNVRPKRRRWCECRRIVCIATVVLVVGVALAIGLIVGLKVRNHHNNNENTTKNSTSSGINGGFPAGQYGITTYLNDTDTSCVSNPSTWRCPPFTTYAASPEASLTTIGWTIAAQSGGNYTISSADPLFSYRFQNVSLTKMLPDTDDEYWGFTTRFDKPIIPTAAIASSGVISICFFYDTLLEGRLYTRRPMAAALQQDRNNSNSNSNSNAFQSWPYALEYTETRPAGVGVPQCFEYANNQIGKDLGVNFTVAATGAGDVPDCRCSYTNYF